MPNADGNAAEVGGESECCVCVPEADVELDDDDEAGRVPIGASVGDDLVDWLVEMGECSGEFDWVFVLD